MIRLVYGVVVLGLTIWVTADASRLGAHKGATGGGFLDMGPVGWFFACFFLWIVAFPCYLVHRRKLIAAKGTYYTPPGAAYAPAPTYWPAAPPRQQGPWLNGYQPPVEQSWPPPGHQAWPPAPGEHHPGA